MPNPRLPKLVLTLGSFYRDRAGYKYVCFSEKEDTTFFYCLRIHTQTTVLYNPSGEPVLEKHEELVLVEEVRSDAPVFVDPTALIETVNYDAMWDRVQTMQSGIEIMKYSPSTAARDVLMSRSTADMPSDIRNKLTRDTIGKLWRVRLNKQTRARYEWDIDKAVALVMSRVGDADGD